MIQTPAAAAPPIYSRLPESQRLGWRGRLLAFSVAVGCLAVLSTAVWLRPDSQGFGTHQQLKGLQPCAFLQRFGVPCIACGMTTSFSYFVRGRLLPSLYVQPMGMVLAALCALAAWGGLFEAFTGRALHRLLRILPVDYYLWTLFVFAIAAWAWKITIHLAGHDGWNG